MKVLVKVEDRYPDYAVKTIEQAQKEGFSEEDPYQPFLDIPDEKFQEWVDAIDEFNKIQTEIDNYITEWERKI